jgi:hypothetical protein
MRTFASLPLLLIALLGCTPSQINRSASDVLGS